MDKNASNLENSLQKITFIYYCWHWKSKYTLNYFDSRLLNIPFVERAGSANIGGNKYTSYNYEKLEIIFETVDGHSIIEKFPVKILRPSSGKIAELEELEIFPNILGLDFLKLGYKFICDLINEEIYLEEIKPQTPSQPPSPHHQSPIS